ncbi:MAG: histidine kinase dimerization/phosphoacceptor domain -containing protein [Aureispira sp.]
MRNPLFYIPIFLLFCWLSSLSKIQAQATILPTAIQQPLEEAVQLYDNKHYKKASLILDDLITQVQAMDNKQLLGQLYFNLGTFYKTRNVESKSLDLFLQSSQLLDRQFSTERSNIIVPPMEESPSTYLLDIPKDAAMICDVYNKIGGVYFKQQNYKKAKKYWKKAYKVAKRYKSARALAKAYNNLGELDRIQNRPTQALNYYKQALLLQETIKDSTGILISWSNIGTIYLERDHADSAKYYYDKAYQAAQHLNNPTSLLCAYRDYGVYYHRYHSSKEALSWNKKTLQLAQQEQDLDILVNVHKRLANLYEQQQEWDSLLIHQELWSNLQQEKFQQKRQKMAMQIEAEYIVHQQEKEVQRLRQQAVLEEEKNRRRDTLQWSISIGLLFLLLGTLWILRLTRKRDQEATVHLHEIEQQNAEKEILLKEIHHRVKNNLQVVTSLLHLQSYDIEDPATRLLFDQSQYRINSMAMIHEMLYQSHDLSAIDYQQYLKQLVNKLVRSIKGSEEAIQLDLSIAPIRLNIDTAIPLGLLSTELITNSLKYGLDQGKDSILTVHLQPHDTAYLLKIGDNGKGMELDWTKAVSPQSLGLRLIKQLSRQLDGKLVQTKEKPGVHYELSFQEVVLPS